MACHVDCEHPTLRAPCRWFLSLHCHDHLGVPECKVSVHTIGVMHTTATSWYRTPCSPFLHHTHPERRCWRHLAAQVPLDPFVMNSIEVPPERLLLHARSTVRALCPLPTQSASRRASLLYAFVHCFGLGRGDQGSTKHQVFCLLLLGPQPKEGKNLNDLIKVSLQP